MKITFNLSNKRKRLAKASIRSDGNRTVVDFVSDVSKLKKKPKVNKDGIKDNAVNEDSTKDNKDNADMKEGE